MMSRILRGALLGIFLGIVGGMAIGGLTYHPAVRETDNTAVLSMQNSVSNDIIRFHIRANSDTVEDQLLKMQIKDYVLEILNPIMKNAASLDKAQELILAKMPFLKSQLESYMQNAGYDYNVEIYFQDEDFPMKQYGDMTFPAGTYHALRIDIGEKEGQNWWCVMYPSLCFLDATHAVLNDVSKEELRRMLTPGEYDSLMASNGYVNGSVDTNKNVVYYHSKLWDELQKFFN